MINIKFEQFYKYMTTRFEVTYEYDDPQGRFNVILIKRYSHDVSWEANAEITRDEDLPVRTWIDMGVSKDDVHIILNRINKLLNKLFENGESNDSDNGWIAF